MAAARVVTMVVVVLAGRANNLTFEVVAEAWDGQHYVRNAAQGYPEDSFVGDAYVGPTLAFYPLYSMVLRAAVALTPLPYAHAGVLVSFAFSLTAAAVLWRVVADAAGRDTANRFAVLLAFLPGSYALSLIYAEGLMLTLAGATLLLLARRRWPLAGLVAALCTATRPNAIVIVACCAWAAFAALRDGDRDGRDWRALAAPALAPLGAVAFHLYLWRHTGEAWAWFTIQRRGWQERVDPLSIVDFIRYYLKFPLNDYQGMTVLAGTVVLIVAFVLLVRDRAPATWLIWAGGVSLLVLTSSNLGARPRFVMTAFPLLVPVARRLSPLWLGAVLGVLGMLTGWLAYLTVTSRFIVP